MYHLTFYHSCQTHDQKTALAAQIARASAVFSVDEIIIFNDGQSSRPRPAPRQQAHGGQYRDYAAEDEASGYTGYSDPDDFLYHVLSYLETPPHLRRMLFPMHPNLRTAGAMPSLDMPHHMKANEWCQYREGVTMGPSGSGSNGVDGGAGKKRKNGGSEDSSTLVDCGLPVKVRIPAEIDPDTRVTVKFSSTEEPYMDGYTPLDAEAVSPDAPREEAGYYWGYSCRVASSLSAIFTETTYEGGYDLSIGTSERGVSVQDLVGTSDREGLLPGDWQHLLLVYGGVAGLETALAADAELLAKGVTDVKDLFDQWVNLVPGQGSRTIRTEEAVWLGLMGFRPVVTSRQ